VARLVKEHDTKETRTAGKMGPAPRAGRRGTRCVRPRAATRCRSRRVPRPARAGSVTWRACPPPRGAARDRALPPRARPDTRNAPPSARGVPAARAVVTDSAASARPCAVSPSASRTGTNATRASCSPGNSPRAACRRRSASVRSFRLRSPGRRHGRRRHGRSTEEGDRGDRSRHPSKAGACHGELLVVSTSGRRQRGCRQPAWSPARPGATVRDRNVDRSLWHR
jgi:hypothetical protein